MNFGNKIKHLRKEAGLSQEDLAAKLGVSQKSICNYENNTRFPKGQKVIKGLADIFNVTVDYLISDTDDTTSKENIFISSAKDEFGYKCKNEAEMLIERTAAVLAGGELSEEDKDAFFQSITQLYFEAKNKARKKYGKKNSNSETEISNTP
ncbi:helix-turn-helix transcriptional regulator [Clostridium sp. 19966]|uniref:HTH-type transcriptional regulator ImmR n=1 Tax=Clostridium butyricum TaxID=1492 RepID=A0A6N3A319_CLOBU|nr:helix-turn-helix transcriptional regulator [Clostridium sp. 19966]MDT8717005.1 helix-turn-helix transcriptional regulator [Clostridium sp. 19966]